MDWKDILSKLAPTVASAFLGPLGGDVVQAVGSILGISDATQDKIKQAIESGSLTPEHIAEIKKLELQYQENEKERGFRYAELAFKDRDSARTNNVQGGTQVNVFWMSAILLTVCIGAEIAVLFLGYPPSIPEIVVGRVLGLLDAVATLVLSYWYGTSAGSAQKTELLSQAQPIEK